MEEKLDERGDLLEPDHRTLEVNLKSVMNTVALAIHYMRHQETGGSIVLSGSASSKFLLSNLKVLWLKLNCDRFPESMVPRLW
jgi:hypothetical protein